MYTLHHVYTGEFKAELEPCITEILIETFIQEIKRSSISFDLWFWFVADVTKNLCKTYKFLAVEEKDDIVVWYKVFKNGPIKICERQSLKAVFHKFYLVHSWIPWPICSTCSVMTKLHQCS